MNVYKGAVEFDVPSSGQPRATCLLFAYFLFRINNRILIKSCCLLLGALNTLRIEKFEEFGVKRAVRN